MCVRATSSSSSQMNIRISGNLLGPTVVLLAGWPDTCDVFETNLAEHFRSKSGSDAYRVVGISLPGFDDDVPLIKHYRDRMAMAASGHHGENQIPLSSFITSAANGKLPVLDQQAQSPSCSFPLRHFLMQRQGLALMKTPRLGYSLADLVSLLEIAVDSAMETHNYHHEDGEPVAPPVLICHGWSCLLAYELIRSRPSLFSKLVVLDVGGAIFDHEQIDSAISYERGGNEVHRAPPAPATATAEAAASPVPVEPKMTGNFMTRVVLVWWHGLLIMILLCVPRLIANLFLRFMLWLAGRPSYSPPQELSHLAPHVEAFNNQRDIYFYTHLQHNKAIVDESFGVDRSFFNRYGQGWNIVLFPCIKTNVDGADRRGRQRVRIVRKGYVKAATAAERSYHRIKQAGTNSFYSAYDSSLGNLTFQNAPCTAAGEASSEQAAGGLLDSKSRTLWYKWEVTYQAYYIPPSNFATRSSPTTTGSSQSFGPLRRGIRLAFNNILPAQQSSTPRQSRKQPRSKVRPVVRGTSSMGWIFLRYAGGAFLSRVFSPRSNWANKKKRQPTKRQAQGSGQLIAVKPEDEKDVDPKDSSHSEPFLSYQVMHSPFASQRFFFPIEIPVLFLYGKAKRCMLHSSQWCDYIEQKGLQDGQSKVVALEGGNHWFFSEKAHAATVIKEVDSFVSHST